MSLRNFFFATFFFSSVRLFFRLEMEQEVSGGRRSDEVGVGLKGLALVGAEVFRTSDIGARRVVVELEHLHLLVESGVPRRGVDQTLAELILVIMGIFVDDQVQSETMSESEMVDSSSGGAPIGAAPEVQCS